MRVKVRTQPTDIFLLNGDDAKEAREVAGCDEIHGGTALVTSSFGWDGHCWDTIEEFEQDWQVVFGEPAK